MVPVVFSVVVLFGRYLVVSAPPVHHGKCPLVCRWQQERGPTLRVVVPCVSPKVGLDSCRPTILTAVPEPVALPARRACGRLVIVPSRISDTTKPCQP